MRPRPCPKIPSPSITCRSSPSSRSFASTATPESPGCDGCSCEACTCAADPYCCNVEWDEICGDQAFDLCDVCCPGDLSGNGVVNGGDLGMLRGAWGSSGPGDLDGNGVVDGADLGILLGNWGPC